MSTDDRAPRPQGPTEPAPRVVVARTVPTAAGAPRTVEVVLTNLADAPRSFTVLVVGVDPAWLPAPLTTPVVQPGQQAVVPLVLAPPVGTFPASYPLAVTVQSLDPVTGRPSAAPAGTADSVLVVNPRAQLGVELSPREVTARGSRRVSVVLRNTGTEAVPVQLTTTSGRGIDVRLRRSAVELAPGQVTRVRGRVSARRGNRVGGATRHPFTITAAAPAVVRRVEGTFHQRALVGSTAMKVVGLVTVLAIWLAAAVVLIPQIAQQVRPDGATESGQLAGDQADGGGSDGGSGGSDGGSGGSDGGSDGGSEGSGEGGDAQSVADTEPDELQLSGTVAAADPGGVQVSLETTSLVDEAAQGGRAVGVSTAALSATGMSASTSFSLALPRRTQTQRSASTTSDGSWAFPAVAAPGYYLLTFSKAGYQTQRFVVDSTSAKATEPLEVDLVPGEGRLSGRVTGPDGPVAGAEITLTDGTSTITTSTNSRGSVGSWAVEGLSTPSAYVVTAAKEGLSTESRLVDLGAGGEGSASLQLRRGVASLSGTVTGDTANGDQGGLGGITVTVTGGPDLVRTSTTATRKPVGRYTLPGLPSPGRYTVTFSGRGYQTQVNTVRIARGAGGVTLDAALRSSAGVVTGRVLDADGVGLVGAGQVLSDGENTYKTTTTSAVPGAYRFNGVTPGTYTLTTQLFGYATDVATVTVEAGATVSLDRVLQDVEGGVLPSTSRITGTVVDATTDELVDACDPGERCLTATLRDVVQQPDGTQEVVTYRSSFAADEAYTLPEVADGGLQPGLQRVTVTAPGYLPGTVQVQVPRSTTVEAETIRLFPAPVLAGTVSTVVGATPSGPTCVFIVPGPIPDADPALDDCQTAVSAGTCIADDAEFDGTSDPARPTCVYVDGAGDYRAELPTIGTFTAYVRPTDPEYVPARPFQVNLDRGDSLTYDVALDRLGILTVTVLRPGPGNALVRAPGALVAVGTLPARAADADGVLVTRALQPATYTVTGTDAANASRTSSKDVFVGLNQEASLLLPLINPIPTVTGKVTTVVDGQTRAVNGARVAVVAPSGYVDVFPVNRQVVLSTDDEGCFAIAPDATTPPGVAGSCDGAWPGTSLARNTPIVSDTAASVVISAPGFVGTTLTNAQLSTTDLNSYVLEPAPVTVAATATTTPSKTVDWAASSVTVTPADGSAGVSASLRSLSPGTTSSVAASLVWADPRYPSGQARPGTYTIVATLPGHDTLTRTLTCAVGGSCSLNAPLVFQQRGSLAVIVVDRAGQPVNQAEVVLVRDGVEQTRNTGTGSTVTFDGLSPGVGQPYTVRVRAAGVAFVDTATPAATYTFTCTPPVSSGGLTINPGQQTQCTVATDRLGAITGEVQGILAKAPAETPFRLLAGVTVTATRCTSNASINGTLYCTATDAADSFTTTTDNLGQYTVTGTTTRAGLRSGTWLVRYQGTAFTEERRPGVPATALPGTAVAVIGGETSTAVVKVRARPVAFTVKLRDQSNAPVEGATVVLRQSGTDDLPGVESTTVAGDYVASDVVPGSYTVTASGPGLITSNIFVTVGEGGSQSVFMSIGRGANTASGTVRDASGPLAGVVVEMRCGTGTPYGATRCPADGPALGVNNAPLRVTTGADGRFELRTVPDGPYVLRYSKRGYRTVTGPTLTYDYQLGAVPPQDQVLTLVDRAVAITVTTSRADDDLSGGSVTLTPGPGTTGTAMTMPLGGSGGTTSATFPQVNAGCWSVSLTLPAGHFGDVSALDQTAATQDPSLGCAAGRLQVSAEDDAVPSAASLTVTESAIVVSVPAAVPITGHTAPTSAVVTLRRAGGGDLLVDEPTFALPGTVTVWVPPGSYTARAAAPAGFAPVFWPPAAPADVTVAGDDPALTVSLELEEVPRDITVTVAGLPASEEATITVTAPAAQGATVTGTFTTSGGSVVVPLPEGPWGLSATSATGSAPPTSFTSSADGPGSVTLTWQATAPVDPVDPTVP